MELMMMMGYMVVLVVHIRFYHCNLIIINYKTHSSMYNVTI